jgi:small multidrug resistance family-3 protein
MTAIFSLLVFVLSGLCELGGGYLIWLWLREGKSLWLALVGALLLTTYGFVATLQPANFGRAYAAYGGIFIMLSILCNNLRTLNSLQISDRATEQGRLLNEALQVAVGVQAEMKKVARSKGC